MTKLNWGLDAAGWCPEADVWENQRLCSAAPDLLEACKMIMDNIKNVAITNAMQDELRAAIRKAEGGDA